MTIASVLIDNFKLRLACEKVAEGIAELQNLGLTKEQIMNGLQVQVDAFFRDTEKEVDQG